jgi:hypothetical protein
MSFYNELNAAVYSQLSGGTALVSALGGTAIYHGVAPEGRALPYVVWSYQASNRDNWTPSDSAQSVLFVRAYAATAKKAAEIDDSIADLMKTNLTLTNWTNFWLAREEELFLPETNETGVTTWMCGAYYRVRLDK